MMMLVLFMNSILTCERLPAVVAFQVHILSLFGDTDTNPFPQERARTGRVNV